MTHLYKKPKAVQDAGEAAGLLTEVMELMGRAEMLLVLAGYRGAAHGIHQAKLRVESWRGKVWAEIEAANR